MPPKKRGRPSKKDMLKRLTPIGEAVDESTQQSAPKESEALLQLSLNFAGLSVKMLDYVERLVVAERNLQQISASLGNIVSSFNGANGQIMQKLQEFEQQILGAVQPAAPVAAPTAQGGTPAALGAPAPTMSMVPRASVAEAQAEAQAGARNESGIERRN